MQKLHVHVVATVAPKYLCSEDQSIPGTYEVSVADGLSEGVAEWGAKEAFHTKNGISEIDYFEVRVFDPLRKRYLEESYDEPTLAEKRSTRYSYHGKLDDRIPKVQAKSKGDSPSFRFK